MGKHKSKKHHKKYGDDEERKHKSRSLDPSEKPLKLVFKIGGGKETFVNKEKKSHHSSKHDPDRPKSKDHSKKKKKKRSASKERKKHKLDPGSSACPSPASMSSHDKSKKKRDRVEMEGDDVAMDMERPIKKIHIKPIEPPPRPVPEVKPKASKKKPKDPTALQLCLENLLCIIQRKDVQGFFAFPVNDAIAPGYSRVIEHPMDFSTIRTKIDTNQYSTIEAFRDDFHLMCTNATVYNAPDTIYYKAAKRLLQIGDKMMSLDKIRNMYRSMGMRVTDIDVGNKDLSDEPIDVDTIDSDHPVIPVHTTSRKKTKSSKSDTRPSVVGRKILAQVQEAAKRVSSQLKEKYPNSKIGFLRRNKDGSTSLAFVNPDSSQESVPVNLGTTTPKVTTGSQVTTGFKEDKKNKATPVSYLMYGSFGSFAPTYDSSRATITKEESDLLLSTYGNDTGVHYAQSIQEFVKDTSSFAVGVVDKVLDVLTDGAHSKYKMKEKVKLIEEIKTDSQKVSESTAKPADSQTKEQKVAETGKAPKQPEVKKDEGAKPAHVPMDITSLLSLSEVGIDVSFLKDIADTTQTTKKPEAPHSSLMDQLNSTGRLLEDLQEAQNSRLSTRPGDPLSATPDTATKPSEKEQSLANRLTSTLKELTSQVGPGVVAEAGSLRAAMGVGPLPSGDTSVAKSESNTVTSSKEYHGERQGSAGTPMEL